MSFRSSAMGPSQKSIHTYIHGKIIIFLYIDINITYIQKRANKNYHDKVQ